MPSVLGPVENTPYLGGLRPGFLAVDGTGRQQLVKHQLTAVVDPTSLDDGGAGYARGSRWITSTGKVWECVDPAPLAAIWKDLTGATNPAGSGTELQVRAAATAFGAVSGSSWDGVTLGLPLATQFGVTDPARLDLVADANGSGWLAQRRLYLRANNLPIVVRPASTQGLVVDAAGADPTPGSFFQVRVPATATTAQRVDLPAAWYQANPPILDARDSGDTPYFRIGSRLTGWHYGAPTITGVPWSPVFVGNQLHAEAYLLSTGNFELTPNQLLVQGGIALGGFNVRIGLDTTYQGNFQVVNGSGVATFQVTPAGAVTIQATASPAFTVQSGGSVGLRVDQSLTAGETRLLVYDVDSASSQRVRVGGNGTGPGGVGRALYLANV